MDFSTIWSYLTTSYHPEVVLLLIIIGGLGFLLKQAMQINRSVNHRDKHEKSIAELTAENNGLICETHRLAVETNAQVMLIEGRLRGVEKTLRRHGRKLARVE